MDESVANVSGEAEDDEPTVIQFRDVTAAAYRIKKGVKETPLEVGGVMACRDIFASRPKSGVL